MAPTPGREGEAMPSRVEATLAFFRESGLWHVLSRNSPATSCRDAAARRRRLGSEGIPLHDELKSLCVVCYGPSGERSYAMIHSRANARIDLEAAGRHLGTTRPLARLSAEELASAFGAQYGTVNPFSEPERFTHLFDQSLLTVYTAPHTMMTNAGDLTWAVEFEPEAVIDALQKTAPRVEVARIAIHHEDDHHLPVFGIITGNGPESGMTLWRHLNERIYAGLEESVHLNGDLSYPKVMIHSLPEMGLSMELAEREEPVWAVIKQAVEQLLGAGATHLALACNTTPYFAARIRALCTPRGARFISIAEVAEEKIRREKIEDVTLIGIPVVAEMGRYSAYRNLADLNIRQADPRVLQDLQELGYMVKRMNVTGQDNKALNKLQHILRAGVETKRVLIALTEISVLLERFPRLKGKVGDKEVIDPLRLYGEALAKIYLNALPDEEGFDDDRWE
ncbi:YbaK/EbsC family protein [Endothiovibrio diazotrophicus]